MYLAAALAALSLSQAQPQPQLVDAAEVVDGLLLDIRYATAQNFVGRPLYAKARCLLLPGVAKRLAKAQALLRAKGYALKVYDCYRPRSIQRALWEAHPVRGEVAPPGGKGSNHNRGAAVDVGLARLDGGDVAMPTEYDDFSEAAWAASERPSAEAKRHRAILQDAMRRAGFTTIKREWWHFDAPEGREAAPLDQPL